MSRRLLIIAHAPSANTRALAEALLAGARDPQVANVVADWIPPLQANAGHVLRADAVILATTENFGYMSGALKDFFDRIYYPCLESTQGLPYALLVRAGNDGSGARDSVERIVTGLRWKPVQQALICSGDYRDEWLEEWRQLGMAMAAGLEAGVY